MQRDFTTIVRLVLLYMLAILGRPFVQRRTSDAAPARVLLIKPDHLGDVLLATPALRSLRQQYPQAFLVVLAGPWSRPLLADNPDKDVLMTLRFPGFDRGASKSSLFAPYVSLVYYAMLLRAGRFDSALLLRDDHWWGAALALLAGIPQRNGYAVPACKPLLTTALPWNPRTHVTRQALALVQDFVGKPYPNAGSAGGSPAPGRGVVVPTPPHRRQRNGHSTALSPSPQPLSHPGSGASGTPSPLVGEGAGGRGADVETKRHPYASIPLTLTPMVPNSCPITQPTSTNRVVQSTKGGKATTVYTEDCEQFPLVYTPPADDQTWVQTWLQEHMTSSTRGGSARRLVVLHPGTGGRTKLWPDERWAAVANRLVEQYGVQIVLTGGPGEEELVQQLASLLHVPPAVLAGTLSIGQLTVLLGMADLVLGVDSGPLHLAVSQQTPTIHLYGASDAQRFGPWGPASRHVVVQAHLWCSPCGVFDACPRQTNPPECMDALTVEQVVQVASRLLGEWRMENGEWRMENAGQPDSRTD